LSVRDYAPLPFDSLYGVHFDGGQSDQVVILEVQLDRDRPISSLVDEDPVDLQRVQVVHAQILAPVDGQLLDGRLDCIPETLVRLSVQLFRYFASREGLG
jgi:hypothetical protein